MLLTFTHFEGTRTFGGSFKKHIRINLLDQIQFHMLKITDLLSTFTGKTLMIDPVNVTKGGANCKDMLVERIWMSKDGVPISICKLKLSGSRIFNICPTEISILFMVNFVLIDLFLLVCYKVKVLLKLEARIVLEDISFHTRITSGAYFLRLSTN